MPDYKFTTHDNNEKFETGLFNSDGKTDVIASTPVGGEGTDKVVKSANVSSANTATASNQTVQTTHDNKALETLESKIDAKLTEFNSKIDLIKSDLSKDYQQKINDLKIEELRQQLDQLDKADKKPDFDGFNQRLQGLEANKDQIEQLLLTAKESIDKKDTNLSAIKDLTQKLNDNYSRLNTEVQNLWEEIAKLKGRIPLKIFDCESKSSSEQKSDAKETPITIFDCENKKDPQLIKIFDCKSDEDVADAKEDVNASNMSSSSSYNRSNVVDSSDTGSRSSSGESSSSSSSSCRRSRSKRCSSRRSSSSRSSSSSTVCSCSNMRSPPAKQTKFTHNKTKQP